MGCCNWRVFKTKRNSNPRSDINPQLEMTNNHIGHIEKLHIASSFQTTLEIGRQAKFPNTGKNGNMRKITIDRSNLISNGIRNTQFSLSKLISGSIQADQPQDEIHHGSRESNYRNGHQKLGIGITQLLGDKDKNFPINFHNIILNVPKLHEVDSSSIHIRRETTNKRSSIEKNIPLEEAKKSHQYSGKKKRTFLQKPIELPVGIQFKTLSGIQPKVRKE